MTTQQTPATSLFANSILEQDPLYFATTDIQWSMPQPLMQEWLSFGITPLLPAVPACDRPASDRRNINRGAGARQSHRQWHR